MSAKSAFLSEKRSDAEGKKTDRSILDWLLEKETPEVKLGYDQEDTVKNEIACILSGIKEDGGFGCISTNKKINDPRKPHKSCARLTVEYLLLVAELHRLGYRTDCERKLVQYFTKRNIFYRTDDMKTAMVDVMLGTFYPSTIGL